MADPSGLFAFIGPLLSGLAGATGIATLGAGGAALTADGLGALANKNEGDPFKATKGTAKAVAGAAAINAGIGATAASGAGIAKAVPAAAAAAPTIIRQGKEATKAISNGINNVTRNPSISKPLTAAEDFVNSALPTGSPMPSKAGYAGGIYGQIFDVEEQIYEANKWLKKQFKSNGQPSQVESY